MRRNTMAPVRRTTLGPVSHSGLNARSSLGGPMRPPKGRGAQSTLSKSTDDDRRFGRRATATAIIGSTKNDLRRGSRPSMTYSNSRGIRSDPRPLHDKQYMQQCVKSLISYVIDHGYEQPISPKILTNPSSRDFQHIFLFLMRKIDNSFSFQKRFEDEVPAILKGLGYPFTISKSALSAVGSPHTWPTLLGVLTWLMGLLKYGGAMQQRDDADQELDPHERRQQIFYDNMVDAYVQFLQGADDFPELDNALCQHFEEENSRREAEIAKIQADRDELAATLNTLQTQPSPLELIVEHRTSLETNIHKFQLLIPSLIEHNNNVQKKIKDKEAEIENDETELTTLMEEKMQLQHSLAVQEEAGIDSERMVADKERLRDGLRKLRAQRAQCEREQREAEQQLAEGSSVLDDAVRSYHKLAASLEPVTSNPRIDPKTIDWELSVSRDTAITEAEKILSKNVETDILPVLRELKEQTAAAIPSLQAESLKYQDRIDEVEERLIVLRNELSLLESRKGNLENEYQKKRAAMGDQLQARSQAILQKEQHMSYSLNEKRERLLKAEKQLQNFTDDLNAHRVDFAQRRKILASIAERGFQQTLRYQESVKKSASMVEKHFKQERGS